MLNVVCWLWDTPRYRTTFTAAHVNAFAANVGRHYRRPHRVLCVTNLRQGIAPGIVIVPDRADFSNLTSPSGRAFPSCYRRLRLFHPDAAQWFGDRFVSVDLDFVATGDLAPLWDMPDEFVAYRDPTFPRQYCGSMLLLTAGARPYVWQAFDPIRSPVLASHNGFRGSDQAWISYAAPFARLWGVEHGVYSYQHDIARRARGELPEDARAVVFHGRVKPWDEEARRLEWVREHWRARDVPHVLDGHA